MIKEYITIQAIFLVPNIFIYLPTIKSFFFIDAIEYAENTDNSDRFKNVDFSSLKIGFFEDYTQCQEDNKPFFTEDTWNTMCSRIDELQSELSKKKYTEEDIKKAFMAGCQSERRFSRRIDELDKYINSLNKQD